MAQKIQTLLIDDLDGGEAETTVRFGLDGTEYEIDLSAKNADALRRAVARYVDAARRAPAAAARRPGRNGRRPAVPTEPIPPRFGSGPSPRALRLRTVAGAGGTSREVQGGHGAIGNDFGIRSLVLPSFPGAGRATETGEPVQRPSDDWLRDPRPADRAYPYVRCHAHQARRRRPARRLRRNDRRPVTLPAPWPTAKAGADVFNIQSAALHIYALQARAFMHCRPALRTLAHAAVRTCDGANVAGP